MENTFNDLKKSLTEKDIDELTSLLGHRCYQRTKSMLMARLKFHTDAIPKYGILERLTKDANGWSYCAGQSYPDEIRTVRKIIIDLK